MQGLSSKIQCAISVLILNAIVCAGDWPQWGHDATRNMSAPATGLPDSFNPGDFIKNSEEIDLQTTQNVKWIAKLGSQSYGNPTAAGGRVFVGTNNESPRDPKHRGDRGVVMCFDEQTGRFLWQLTVPKLGSGKINDWEYLGICSSPTVDGGRVYVVTNRCEVVCMDAKGLSDGNDGPFNDEGKYMAGSGKPPIEPGPTDADIIWRYDMREELGIFPHNIASSSVLVVKDRVFVTTSNGQDWSHVNIPNPMAPTLIALDKKTGALLGEEGSGISERLFHCNWSSPAYGTVNGKGIVMFGAGDGFCYGFDPNPVEDEEGFKIFREIWRYDCNPPAYRTRHGKPIRYVDPEGPSEIIATPVFYKNRIYVAVGQDPEHGEGVGMLSCIDATKIGDISKTGAVWQYKDINRSVSTVSIVDGLVYAADYAGDVHCLDADTGQAYWVHDTKSHIWASTLVADGKVYIGNEDGILTILQAGKEHKLLNEVEVPASIYSSPIVANGVVYLATHTHLYAIQKQK